MIFLSMKIQNIAHVYGILSSTIVNITWEVYTCHRGEGQQVTPGQVTYAKFLPLAHLAHL